MTDVNETAKLLALCAGVFHRQDHLALDAARQAEACRELNEYGILSIRAISAVVGCSEYRVEQALRGLPRPTARGKLNPQHLPWLAYMLDGKVRKNWVE